MELCVAGLGKQLDTYSHDMVSRGSALLRSTNRRFSESEEASFLTAFHAELHNKRFQNEPERECVRTIVAEFVSKRKLYDAIKSGNVSEVSDILGGISSDRLQMLIGQPVDAGLNTPLHIAVAAGQSQIVKLLLEHGADRQVRNLWGDTPTQFFMVPRIR